MFNKPFRGKKTDGFKGGKRFGGGSGGSDWKPMHKAICNDCGSSCQVPFKPNGSRPVLCSHCFQKSNDSGPRKFSDDRRPSFQERSGGGNNDQISEQLKTMNAKLDAIIEALES